MDSDPNASEAAPVWERLDGEPAKWFGFFERFRRIGPSRSVLQVYRDQHLQAAKGRKGSKFSEDSYTVPRELPGSWRKIVQDWAWRERAAHFDEWEMSLEERTWKARRAESRRTDWDIAERLRQRALQMLSLPVLRQKVEEEHYDDGRARTVTIIEPADWTLRDVVAIARMASDLAARATGRDQVAVPVLMTAMEEFTDEELREVRAGADPAEILRRREGGA